MKMQAEDRITVRLPKALATKVKSKRNYAKYVRDLITADLLKESVS